MSLIRGAVLIASLTLASVTPAAAQWTAGAKGGMSIARFTGSSLDRSEWARGLTGGVFLTTHLVEELSFQAEVMYVRKGAAISLTQGSTRRSGTLRLDYLEVPFLLRVDWPQQRLASLHLIGGPAVAIRLRCSFDDDDSTYVTCASGGLPLGTRTLDGGMLGGAGVDLDLDRARIVTEVRFAFGLMTIDTDQDLGRTNEAFTLVMGIAVPVGAGTPRAAVR
jgi:hypothetical protein